MKAVKAHDGIELQKRMEKYEKIDKIKEDNPTVDKQYLETRIIYDCRMIFRIRTEMLDLKDNMGRRYKGSNTYCEACDQEVPLTRVSSTCYGVASIPRVQGWLEPL